MTFYLNQYSINFINIFSPCLSIGNEATFECSAWVGVASLSVSHNEINNVNAEEDLDALFDEQHNENSETESEIVETDTISHASK